MKLSAVIAGLLVVGSGAAGAAAVNPLPHPFYGSDALFNVTRTAIANENACVGIPPPGGCQNIGLPTSYVGGGSGVGLAAMSHNDAAGDDQAATQQIAPMTRMFEFHVCSFNGAANGGADTNASGIVLGIDAVSLLSNTQSGGQAIASCGSLAANGTTGVFAGGGLDPQNWKWILALVYGGLDLSTCTGHMTGCAPADCNSPARRNLVANWSLLFQGNACTPSTTVTPAGVSASVVCSTGVSGGGGQPNGALWHAFRPDDASGTADLFASVLGLTPRVSVTANNGFGQSPYCNAMNWDTSTPNTSGVGCGLGLHDQLTGPGGVVDPQSTCTIGGSCAAAGSGNHRKPPPGTWGEAPLGLASSRSAWDVLPTQMQDNDPVRRPCLGNGKTNNANIPGEEVCGLDSALGLVVPLVASNWIVGQTYAAGPPLVQYPMNPCNSFLLGTAPKVFNCPVNRATVHDGECPNGDSELAGGCMVPIDATNNRSDCVSTKATIPVLVVRSTLGFAYGRAYNLHMRDGTMGAGGGLVGYAQYPIGSGATVDFTGAFNRIHQVATAVGTGASSCQLADMTDQIGCEVAADPCSIGFAGLEASIWQQQPNGGHVGTNPGIWLTSALDVRSVAPSTTTIQNLSYPLWRKVYVGSLRGFGAVNAAGPTPGDPGAPAEIILTQYESNTNNIMPILSQYDYFPLGPPSPQGSNAPYCEDFNEQTICSAPSNRNGCNNNISVAGIPGDPSPDPTASTVSTVCGNGKVEAYEECDGLVGAGSGGCSPTCRCILDYNPATRSCL
jgi:hypothetical protein